MGSNAESSVACSDSDLNFPNEVGYDYFVTASRDALNALHGLQALGVEISQRLMIFPVSFILVFATLKSQTHLTYLFDRDSKPGVAIRFWCFPHLLNVMNQIQ